MLKWCPLLWVASESQKDGNDGMKHQGVGLGGVFPPKSQEIFENLVLKWCPLRVSKMNEMGSYDKSV